MEYKKGLIKRKLSHWVGRQWYHQRFDGSPYFIHLISEGEIRDEPRKKGCDNYVHFCFYKENAADWYIEMEDIKRIYTKIIALSKKNKNISEYFIEQWKKDKQTFYQKCRDIKNMDLSRLNNKELITLHDEFAQIAVNCNSSSSIIDGFALGTDELVAEKIKAVLDNSSLKEKIRFSEAFSVLTAPLHLSFINEAEIALLRLAGEIEKKSLKNPKTFEILKKHQKDYFWIQNNYIDDKILDINYFTKEIKKLFQLNIDLEGEVEKIEKTPIINKRKKQELIKELKLNNELKILIKISEDFTYWQDERKKSTFWNTHHFSLILNEIAKRTGINTELLKFMTPVEVSSIFEKKPDKKELSARKEYCVFYWDKEGMEALHTGEAEKVRKAILGETNLSDIDDFRGLTACLGKAIGRAKIVRSVKETHKVEEGDILVAVMTRPDYVPAMKKAAAIVTDEGGVTCHAAIISREMGIPCIIGTKIATKVLKDGDVVEVNANHGWVKLIK